MLYIKDWKKEQETMHHLSQILGKHKLSCMFKEPQWAHVILDVTMEGFSTGMLYYGEMVYSIAVNLIQDQIEILTSKGQHLVPLRNGKTIKEYDEEIDRILRLDGIEVDINKTPQEVPDTTPFNENEHMHHYNSEIAKQVLRLMQFSMKAQEKFINKFRTRKVKPGLFWGTFDVACFINYDEEHHMFDEKMVIESNAFDEHFIEFGFWFGDDNFDRPTFFILPYPFVDAEFTYEGKFPEGARFDEKLTEFVFSIDDTTEASLDKVVAFLEEGYRIFRDHLGWEGMDHAEIPLKMPKNYLDLH